MAFPFKPSKRPFDRNPLEPNGRGKWMKTAPLSIHQNKLKSTPGATVFRILCPATKSGSVIGKGGGIITKIRKETGAKIRIEEIIPGCEERVVVITGPEKEIEDRKGQAKEDDPYIDDADEDDDSKISGDSPKEKAHPRQEGSQSDKATSAAQKALLLVFERIAESDPEPDSIDEESKKSSCVVRLLVLSSQVGCLLGKGGSVIKQMASESGAQIRVLPRDKLPACASPVDELVQITGGIDAVRKALQSISQQLLENPPRDRDLLLPDKIPGPSSHPFAPLPQLGIPRMDVLPPSSYHLPDQGPPFSGRPREMLDFHPRMPPSISKFPEIAGPIKVPEPLTFRLICTSDKVGSVIGKGGSIVKIIQSETGCEIKIIETVPDSEDRIVVITGPAHPDDRISPVQDAVLRVQNRIVLASPDNKESTVSSRVIVSSNQTGCLLGKGGSIVAEMRKLSGAQIRILSKDLPKYASENEVVVQGIGGGDGSIGIDDTAGASQRRLGGFAGGSQPSIIANTTVDVVVPRALVPIIRGEDGGCLKQICQISGANITITDPRPGATETVVLISGTPDQTHAAQSLIQAFVLSESGAS